MDYFCIKLCRSFNNEIEEKDSINYKYFEDDFKKAEELADKSVQKGIYFSALIYDREDLVELIKWDENLDQIVYILTSYRKSKGYEIVEPK